MLVRGDEMTYYKWIRLAPLSIKDHLLHAFHDAIICD